MTAAFTHCALHVRNLEESIAFYARYCGMRVVHAHGDPPERQTVWLAEEGREREFVLVLVPGGGQRDPDPDDMTHYGFAVAARQDIDRIAERARTDGCLHWEPMELPPPVGYLCAVRDPTGYVIEFSYGQPLGPGAPSE